MNEFRWKAVMNEIQVINLIKDSHLKGVLEYF